MYRIGSSILFLLVGSLWAQQPAPRETTSVELAGKKVAIEYGRPSLKGRSFESLMENLPPDRMWRAGSEQVTTLTTETPLVIGGEKVPAGKYSLYVHVAEDGPYHLAINKVLGQPLGDIWEAAPPEYAKEPWPHFRYTQEIGDQEVARVELKESESAEDVDLFTIKLEPAGDGARLTLAWGRQNWSTAVKADGGDKPEGSHGY